MPGGESKRVTDRNKKEFIDKATRRRALGGAEQAISAIRSGMGDVIPKHLLSVLLPSEVNLVVVYTGQGRVLLSRHVLDALSCSWLCCVFVLLLFAVVYVACVRLNTTAGCFCLGAFTLCALGSSPRLTFDV